jgi:hypothetical protein
MGEYVVGFGAAIAAVALAVILSAKAHRRRARHDDARRRARELERQRELEPVAPPFEGATCAYCDDEITHECRVCARPTCDDHWDAAEQRCSECVADWRRARPHRRRHLAAMTLGGMAVVAGATLGGGALAYGWSSLLVFFACLVTAIAAGPILFGADYLLRRGFRPGGRIPAARVTRRR